MIEIIVLLLLILLNGIFAMSEIAMVSFKKSRLETDAKRGDKTAKKALELSTNPSKFLSTVQIGITLIGILTGIYSGEKIEDDLENYLNTFDFLIPYSESLAITFIVVTLTFFSLVLGELFPKRIGLAMPETISKLLAYPMYIISIIAAPFIWLLSFTTDLLIKAFHIKKSRESEVTEEEIKAIIQEGTEAGTVQEIEQNIVENVFQLGDIKVNMLMTKQKKIVWLNLNDDFETTKNKITTSPHHLFPVSRGELNNIAGVIYSKDILTSILNNENIELEKIVKKPLFINQDATAYQALELLRGSSQHGGLVVNKYNQLAGILTLYDLVAVLLGHPTGPRNKKNVFVIRDDGTYLVDASVSLINFADYFGVDIHNEPNLPDKKTVGDLILHLSHQKPETGNKFQWHNLLIEV
ncbi:MAG: hemolysin family protein, partial [Bacteroidia bacterium]